MKNQLSKIILATILMLAGAGAHAKSAPMIYCVDAAPKQRVYMDSYKLNVETKFGQETDGLMSSFSDDAWRTGITLLGWSFRDSKLDIQMEYQNGDAWSMGLQVKQDDGKKDDVALGYLKSWLQPLSPWDSMTMMEGTLRGKRNGDNKVYCYVSNSLIGR
jgi:hypothetical protein